MTPAASVQTTVVAAVPPLVVGAAHFNASLVAAMAQRAPVDLVAWRTPYPPLLYRGPIADGSPWLGPLPSPSLLLDWHDPRTWRRALRRIAESGTGAIVLPWLHPVSSLPYAHLLRSAPRDVVRVVICHNVVPHEPVAGWRMLTRRALRHADVLVVHSPEQRRELDDLGLHQPVLDAFHPRFDARHLARGPSASAVDAERARQGRPDVSLLAFGAVRPYKGIDVALDALALVDRALHVRLTVAGRFWNGSGALRARAKRLSLNERVEFRDEYVSNDAAAVLFSASDASLLPYRAASQSGVVQLSFAYGRPVIATRVGGLPAAVRNGRDGILCEPENPHALARAIERMAEARGELTAGVSEGANRHSFARYAELLDDAIASQADR